MIDILNYIVPKKNQNNHLLMLNEKILNHFSEEKFNKIPKYKLIIKLIDIIKDDLSKEEHNIIYNKTEIFRRNNENLNCARHFKVFNKFSVIPEYCFSCYKVQISAKNVSSLIKLFFLFNSNYLENNNVRKCMVETRSNVKENFKGFIYCRGLEEAKKVLKISEKKLIENEIDYKNIEIKHGCTEYYEKHPNFKKINYNGRQEMLYDKSWEKYEKIIDDNSLPVQERVIKPTINNINLSDILIIRNWLDYAQIVGDNSFEKIYSSSVSSNFLSQILKNQLTFRKQQF